MPDERAAAPDSTAVRVALWRAMHVEVDPPPHVLEDEIGLRLVAPDGDWRHRPDMDPHFTRYFRASIVARARFIEDLVVEQTGHGVGQYVIPGAGLDTFAQRRPEIAAGMRVFEIDQPGSPGLEAAAPDGARLRRSGVAAARSRRLRGGRRLVATLGCRRLRRRPADGRGLHRRQHVPHQGRDHRHAAPSRGARSRIDARHDVPAAAGARRTRGAPRASAGGEGRAGEWDAFHQLIHADADAEAGPRSRLHKSPASNRDRRRRSRVAGPGNGGRWDPAKTTRGRPRPKRDGTRAFPAPARNPPG